MAVQIEVNVVNAKAVKRALARLPRRVISKAARRGFRAGAKHMKGGVVDQIVLKGLVDTGRLRDNIEVRSVGGRRGLVFIVRTGTRAKMGIAADDPYYYPAALEFGTEKIRPQKFMREAFLMNAKAVENIVSRELERELIAAEKGHH